MADFPELAGVPLDKSGSPHIQKPGWGPNLTSVKPQSPNSASPRNVSFQKYQNERVCGKCSNPSASFVTVINQTARKESPALPHLKDNAAVTRSDSAVSPGGLETLEVHLQGNFGISNLNLLI